MAKMKSASPRFSSAKEDENDDFLVPLPKHFATTAIHYYHEPENWSALAVAPPLVTACAFKQNLDLSGSPPRNNPTREVFEKSLGALYQAKYCFAFSSGMSAIAAVMALVKSGEHIVCGDDLYGGTVGLFNKIAPSFGITVTYVDPTVEEIVKNIKPNTRMVYIESPTNPCLKVVDIAAVSKITKQRKLLFTVDNSTPSCYLQFPFSLGADIAVDSLTKYVNGHFDVIMGAACTNSPDIAEKIHTLQILMGTAAPPFDCYLCLRSMKAMALRVRRQSKNNLELAKFLETHPKILKVVHPALKSHPQHELARKQMAGHSGLLTMYLKGSGEEAKRFVQSLKLFRLAVSFGGIESLIQIPALMTHTDVPKEQMDKLGITETMIRINVGLENIEDLIEDMQIALDKL